MNEAENTKKNLRKKKEDGRKGNEERQEVNKTKICCLI